MHIHAYILYYMCIFLLLVVHAYPSMFLNVVTCKLERVCTHVHTYMYIFLYMYVPTALEGEDLSCLPLRQFVLQAEFVHGRRGVDCYYSSAPTLHAQHKRIVFLKMSQHLQWSCSLDVRSTFPQLLEFWVGCCYDVDSHNSSSTSGMVDGCKM